VGRYKNHMSWLRMMVVNFTEKNLNCSVSYCYASVLSLVFLNFSQVYKIVVSNIVSVQFMHHKVQALIFGSLAS
jgi:hypothetical protein